MRGTFYWLYRHRKDCRKILWATACQQIGEAIINGSILINTQTPKLSQEDKESLNRSLTSKQIESVIKNSKKYFPTKKSIEQLVNYSLIDLYEFFRHSSKKKTE